MRKRYCVPSRTRTVWQIVGVIALLVSSLAAAQAPIVFQEDFEYGQGGFLINNNYGNDNGLWHLSALCKVLESGHTQNGALF
ncbi:MAG: hypothetical protein ACYSO4_00080, partial [Planctomycetota bacterium]